MPGFDPAGAESLVERARIAVLVPCLNEQGSVATVVRDFKAALPGATVYVYDNDSDDATCATAREAGAVVRPEPRRGKGNVVRRMFADIEADVYVMVDGDDTYDPRSAREMVSRLIEDNLDMVVGSRSSHVEAAFRRGHRVGNKLFGWLHRILFGSAFDDVFSGYRAMSRRFVKSFPTTSSGFEIEAELTAHAIDVKAPSAEVRTEYRARGDGSGSKLRTYRDGMRILIRSILFYKELHPGRFFSALFVLFAFAGVLCGIPVISQYAETGQVPRLPLAVLAASLEVVAFVCMVASVILDSIARRHRELKRLHYLQHHALVELVTPSARVATATREPEHSHPEQAPGRATASTPPRLPVGRGGG